MDQQLSDAWFALEADPELSFAPKSLKPRLPSGRAWIALDKDEDSQLTLLACDRRERLESLLQHVRFHLRARSITVMIEEVAVPVVIVLLRIQGPDEPLLFSAWVNELSPRTTGILGELSEQPQLLIALVDENGRTVGTALARNVLASRMESLRGWITSLARNSPWTRQHFAAAKTYIRGMYPTSEELWARFDEDTASEIEDQEVEALIA